MSEVVFYIEKNRCVHAHGIKARYQLYQGAVIYTPSCTSIFNDIVNYWDEAKSISQGKIKLWSGYNEQHYYGTDIQKFMFLG